MWRTTGFAVGRLTFEQGKGNTMNRLTITVPKADNDGRLIPPKLFDWLEDELVRVYGGWTRVKVRGGWKNDAGDIISEESFRYDILTSMGSIRLEFLAAEVARRWKQETVLVTWEPHITVGFVKPDDHKPEPQPARGSDAWLTKHRPKSGGKPCFTVRPPADRGPIKCLSPAADKLSPEERAWLKDGKSPVDPCAPCVGFDAENCPNRLALDEVLNNPPRLGCRFPIDADSRYGHSHQRP